MKSEICRIFAAALLGLLILGFDSVAARTIERTVSPSGQFIIYGGDPAWRGVVSALAERTKANLLAILQRRDQWTTAAVINLQSRAPNLPEIPSAVLRFSQTGSGLKLQLDLAISREINSTATERELLRVILLEMIYRRQSAIAAGDVYIEPPDWLLEGSLALSPSRDRTPLLRALAVSDRITPLNEFLRTRADLLDSSGRVVHRAYSFALLRLLIETPEGPGRLGCYIDNLSFASTEPLADLLTAFPNLMRNDLEKTWKSKIAAIQRSDRTDLLTFSQTNEKLDALLQTRFQRPENRENSLSLDKITQKKPTQAQRLTLQKFRQDLMLLAAHANPLLRSVVEGYERIVAQLALGKSHGVVTRLAELQILRAQLSTRMSEVADYMNWFEATQLSTRSGLFEDYLNASNTVTFRAHKLDAYSAYLDAMEEQF